MCAAEALKESNMSSSVLSELVDSLPLSSLDIDRGNIPVSSISMVFLYEEEWLCIYIYIQYDTHMLKVVWARHR